MSLEEESKLLISNLSHTINLLRLETKSNGALLKQDREMWMHRIAELEKCKDDFEKRIRKNTEGTTEFRLYMKLAGIGGVGGLGMGGLALLLQIMSGN